jgi:phosphatidylserine/phosphatidylglycerophosphate/cardiolipin synthase-like enzyme
MTVFVSVACGCHSNRAVPIPDILGPVSPETHYAPAENLEALDNRLLRSARTSIDICAFTFTDHELAGALIAAAGRGVKVRIYLDHRQTHEEISRSQRRERRSFATEVEDEEADNDGLLQQLAATPNITVRVKHSQTLMHLKSYVIDGTLLRSGSANFSPTGEKRQDNDLLLTRDSASVQRFKYNFDTLWTRPDNEPIMAVLP